MKLEINNIMEHCAYLMIWGFTHLNFVFTIMDLTIEEICNRAAIWWFMYNLKKLLFMILIFFGNIDWEGHNTYFTIIFVHDSEMLAEINSMEVWMTSLHIIFTNSPGNTFTTYVSSIDLSYNQFSGNLAGLNGSGAFETAVSLEVL
jgi:hypothetical protein